MYVCVLSSVCLRAVISDRFFYSQFASFCRAQVEFSFFSFLIENTLTMGG